jgi:hypothetical protein
MDNYYIRALKENIVLLIEERDRIIHKLINPQINLKQKDISYFMQLKKDCDDELDRLYSDLYDLYEIDY